MFNSLEWSEPEGGIDAAKKNDAFAGHGESRLPSLVEDAVAIILEKYDSLCGVEEMACLLGVSKSHLVRVFSKHMGIPPGRYYNQVRIEAAKQLLANKDYPVEAVAVLSGFSGANYFCRVFRIATGFTPNAFRKACYEDGLRRKQSEMEKRLYL